MPRYVIRCRRAGRPGDIDVQDLLAGGYSSVEVAALNDSIKAATTPPPIRGGRGGRGGRQSGGPATTAAPTIPPAPLAAATPPPPTTTPPVLSFLRKPSQILQAPVSGVVDPIWEQFHTNRLSGDPLYAGLTPLATYELLKDTPCM